MSSNSIIELLADPKRRQAAIERERAARRGAPGWLGLTARYNPQAVLAFGDGVTEAEVHPRGPAYKNRMRTGDVLTAIIVAGERVPLESFYALKLPVRAEVGVEFVRPRATGGAIKLATTLKLAKWPRTRIWELRPRVAAGKRVAPKMRAKYLAEMISYLQEALSAPRNGAGGERRTGWFAVYGFLSFMTLVRDNADRPGVWGRQRDSGEQLGLSRKTVNEILAQLCWVGAIRRLSFASRERDSNLYEVTWPQRDQVAPQPPPVPSPPVRRVRRVRL
jgi:hypothetical protein